MHSHQRPYGPVTLFSSRAPSLHLLSVHVFALAQSVSPASFVVSIGFLAICTVFALHTTRTIGYWTGGCYACIERGTCWEEVVCCGKAVVMSQEVYEYRSDGDIECNDRCQIGRIRGVILNGEKRDSRRLLGRNTKPSSSEQITHVAQALKLTLGHNSRLSRTAWGLVARRDRHLLRTQHTSSYPVQSLQIHLVDLLTHFLH